MNRVPKSVRHAAGIPTSATDEAAASTVRSLIGAARFDLAMRQPTDAQRETALLDAVLSARAAQPKAKPAKQPAVPNMPGGPEKPSADAVGEPKACAKCEAPNDPAAKFCDQCGEPLPEDEGDDSEGDDDKDPDVAATLQGIARRSSRSVAGMSVQRVAEARRALFGGRGR